MQLAGRSRFTLQLCLTNAREQSLEAQIEQGADIASSGAQTPLCCDREKEWECQVFSVHPRAQSYHLKQMSV